MPKTKPEETGEIEPVELITKEIKSFTHRSQRNRMPIAANNIIFDEPLVQFTNGDEHIFAEYKTIIHPTHLTPREALAKAYNKKSKSMPSRLSVISWILPITGVGFSGVDIHPRG